MVRILLFILLSTFVIMTGCTKATTPVELTAVQGDWQFDKARYLTSLHQRYKNPDELKKMLGLYEFAKKNGTPVMTDITIAS